MLQESLRAGSAVFTVWWGEHNTPTELRKCVVMTGPMEFAQPLNRLAEAGIWRGGKARTTTWERLFLVNLEG